MKIYIAERIVAVVEEYCLIDKIFSVTLDNASSNAKAMNTLTPRKVFNETALH